MQRPCSRELRQVSPRLVVFSPASGCVISFSSSSTIVSNATSSPVVGAVMRIDAHVHFMVYDPREHVWVTDELSALKRDFLPADLGPRLKGAGFDGCVAVQARQLPHENEWLLDLRSEEHTSELQSRPHLVCRLL